MGLKICHVSDTHGGKQHSKIRIPECDILIHSGDIGGRTGPTELAEFLDWFNKQPAKYKIFIAGNHDICMDNLYLESREGIIGLSATNSIRQSVKDILKKYSDIIYLENSGTKIEGLNIWGSPITPSFHRQNWAFNADRGEEIRNYWNLIPDDTDILITHGPPYSILDTIPAEFKMRYDEDIHRGCKDLLETTLRLKNLKLHCFGHLHNQYGVIQAGFNTTLYSNGSVLTENYQLRIESPIVIHL